MSLPWSAGKRWWLSLDRFWCTSDSFCFFFLLIVLCWCWEVWRVCINTKIVVIDIRYKDLLSNLPQEVRADRCCTLVLNKIAGYGSVSVLMMVSGNTIMLPQWHFVFFLCIIPRMIGENTSKMADVYLMARGVKIVGYVNLPFLLSFSGLRSNLVLVKQ